MSFIKYLLKNLSKNDKLYWYIKSNVNEALYTDENNKEYYKLPALINNITNISNRNEAIQEVIDCIKDYLSKYKTNPEKFIIRLDRPKNNFAFQVLNVYDLVDITNNNINTNMNNLLSGVSNTKEYDLRDFLIDNYLKHLEISDFYQDSPNKNNTSWSYEFIIKDFFNRFNIKSNDLNKFLQNDYMVYYVSPDGTTNLDIKNIDIYIKFNFVEPYKNEDDNEIKYNSVNRNKNEYYIKFYAEEKILNDISFHESKPK